MAISGTMTGSIRKTPLSRSDRIESRSPIFAFATKYLVLIVVLTGCEKPESLPKPETLPISHAEDLISFELYSTLKGKMARMEELLNAIDRFLDNPEFHERVCEDAREFHRLLAESRGLYPKKLVRPDQPKFDRTIDQTIATSRQLLDSLQASNGLAARKALKLLENQRQDAHAKFSY